MNKVLFFFIFLFSFSFVSAQKSVNNYKYVLVSKQFEFQKSLDAYKVNSLTKFLFNRAGFKAFFTDEALPEDLAKNRCLALKAVVVDESSMFKTKTRVNLIDCYDNSVFTSEIGVSKEKDFKKSYHEAIRNAFVGVEELNYKYSPNNSVEKKDVATDKEVVPTKTEQIKPQIIKKELVESKKPVVLKIAKKDIAVKEEIHEKRINKPSKLSIVGSYLFDKWGKSQVIQNGENYSVLGGDENFIFATIYKTSKPNLFIIKWVTNKQPQLVEITPEGNLKIDASQGIEVIKRE